MFSGTDHLGRKKRRFVTVYFHMAFTKTIQTSLFFYIRSLGNKVELSM
ncbi:hypothetical protein [Mesobacillus maritimus]